MTTRPRHVIVIGAGIVGVSTALSLQREGLDVTLIDRTGPGEGASFGNGGVLAACSVVPVTVPGLMRKAPRMLFDPNQPLFVRWSYMPRMLPWLRRYMSHANAADTRRIAQALAPITSDSLADHQAMADGTPAARWITPCDYLFVYNDRVHFEGDALGWDIRRAHGFDWEELEGAAFHDYDPAFAEGLDFAVRLPGHGRITDPGRYVKDLASHAEAQGARVLQAEVTDIVRDADRVTGVRAGGETLACDAIALCTGAWSGRLARALGVNVPLESERGYHVEFVEPSVMPRAPVMVASGKFVATPMDGRLRLAGVVEFGGLDAPASKGPAELLKRNARAVFPGMTWRDTREWMGHRPAPADSIPVIGEAPGLRGAYLGFGHHHIGLTSGPKTGRLLVQMIVGHQPNIDLTPYSPARFSEAGVRQPQGTTNQKQGDPT
ncbi:FAD-binding oxidoreductase [Psychromarinibacter sp. C21-152]|uniref:FAD-binding oxidoreductase n=1 Tax=Psychromarinibacter sediminicola TaxID=3033385 RepID=A0AAE3NRM7_9RHOB|nr:FAD-binding oxidoreductase [Psychromarinibacter sediminicola]MDF0599685.1 FAD-binding oxidoreductase [Psychromarinibacter sediminicola]